MKAKQNTDNYASTTNRVNTYGLKKKIDVLVTPVAIESLLYLTPSQAELKVNLCIP